MKIYAFENVGINVGVAYQKFQGAENWIKDADGASVKVGLVNREKREARHEIRREISRDYYRDQYYRGGNRWYRDGRYWNEYDYERRYYRERNRGNNNDLLKGVVIGAAAVGVIVAIKEANED